MQLPIYDLLLVFYSGIWLNRAPLQDISLQNLNDLESDLSRSLTITCQCERCIPTYDFLLGLNSNIRPNSDAL